MVAPDMAAGLDADWGKAGQGEAGRAQNLLTGQFADAGDWRTLALIVVVYGGWGALVFILPSYFLEYFPAFRGALLGALVLAPVLTLHSSLQHELLHGHPFRDQRFNDFLASVPVGLFIPYSRFKATHLRHHHDNNLCDPFDDPESWYRAPGEWAARGRVFRWLLTANNCLAGRLVLGPAIGVVGLIRHDFREGTENGVWLPGQWLLHWVAAGAMAGLVAVYSGLPVWAYLVACYLAMSLLMVRTFAEHQSEIAEGAGLDGGPAERRGRSIIVEKGGIFAFLFLNNSLHQVHHAAPGLAWYRLPQRYRDNRERFQAMNKGYTVPGYRTLFARYMLRRKEPVLYPGACHEPCEGGREKSGRRG